MSSTKSLFAGLTVIASLSLASISNATNQINNDNHVINADEYKPTDKLDSKLQLDNQVLDVKHK